MNENSSAHYCKTCKALTKLNDKNRCFFCGYKKLREPLEGDIIYLVTKEFVFARMLEEMLIESNVPHLKQSVRGAGITKGNMGEEFRFFVPYGVYEKAKEIVKDYFSNVNKKAW